MDTLENQLKPRKGIYIPLAGAFIADVEEAKNPAYFEGYQKEERICIGIQVTSTLLSGAGISALIMTYEPQITNYIESLGQILFS